MKEIIKQDLLISVSIYMITYLVKTFVMWQFTNPLQWITNIPNYTTSTRAILLFFYSIYQLALLAYLDDRNNRNNRNQGN